MLANTRRITSPRHHSTLCSPTTERRSENDDSVSCFYISPSCVYSRLVEYLVVALSCAACLTHLEHTKHYLRIN